MGAEHNSWSSKVVTQRAAAAIDNARILHYYNVCESLIESYALFIDPAKYFLLCAHVVKLKHQTKLQLFIGNTIGRFPYWIVNLDIVQYLHTQTWNKSHTKMNLCMKLCTTYTIYAYCVIHVFPFGVPYCILFSVAKKKIHRFSVHFVPFLFNHVSLSCSWTCSALTLL